MIERTVVVLPMPLRPMSVTISPGSMTSVMREQHLAQAIAGLDARDLEQRHLSHWALMPLWLRWRLHLLLLAEVGLAHLGVGADLLRRAGGNDAAIDQHRDTVGEREHRLHVVLDQQDGQFALELAQVSTMRASSGIPAIGSSSSSISGRVASAMAISSCRCSPWLGRDTRMSARPSRPTRVSAARAGSRSA